MAVEKAMAAEVLGGPEDCGPARGDTKPDVVPLTGQQAQSPPARLRRTPGPEPRPWRKLKRNEKRPNLDRYNGKEFEKLLEEAQANIMKSIPNLEMPPALGPAPRERAQWTSWSSQETLQIQSRGESHHPLLPRPLGEATCREPGSPPRGRGTWSTPAGRRQSRPRSGMLVSGPEVTLRAGTPHSKVEVVRQRREADTGLDGGGAWRGTWVDPGRCHGGEQSLDAAAQGDPDLAEAGHGLLPRKALAQHVWGRWGCQRSLRRAHTGVGGCSGRSSGSWMWKSCCFSSIVSAHSWCTRSANAAPSRQQTSARRGRTVSGVGCGHCTSPARWLLAGVTPASVL
ncbi:uncharacterized protein [Oryctolagus cuniculus]|uniref:uncharacterized protein n=1 Tax=Oryctolagus cuniculus TaxID=9986 RepID=UPI003879C8CB